MDPRDYFIFFHVTDASVGGMLGPKHPDSGKNGASGFKGFQVMVFRPWKASLPTAGPGDVVLLRNFVVKSIKGRCSLLSAEYSAWCVWRFGGDNDRCRRGNGTTPPWARGYNQDHEVTEAGVEEVKGPPVEIGSEEKVMVKKLRGWWRNLHLDRGSYNEHVASISTGEETDEQYNDGS